MVEESFQSYYQVIWYESIIITRSISIVTLLVCLKAAGLLLKPRLSIFLWILGEFSEWYPSVSIICYLDKRIRVTSMSMLESDTALLE